MSEIRKTTAGAPGAVVYDITTRIRTTPRGGSANAAPASDQAGITEGARELSRAHTAVQDSRDVRTERVMELRAQIAKGAYQPDAREIAQAILKRGL